MYVGKPEGKRPLRRPRRRWVDNIIMDLREVGCGYMDWIELSQDKDRWRTLVSAVMNLRVPWNAGNFLTSCKPVSFSRRTLHHGVSMYFILWVKYSYCYVFSILDIPFQCVVLCTVCASMCSVLLPPGVNPIAVNKYIVSYQWTKNFPRAPPSWRVTI